ncbi:MAG TPA: glycosyltransferase family 39 protein [Coleofasciculaceae cyanobacterium]
MVQKEQGSRFSVRQTLGAIWLVGALCDRLWLALDHSVPAWDQTNHLTGSLNYLNALQHAQWFSGEWWQSLWKLSSKYPPLTYIATAPFQQLFGTGPDQALLVNLLFSAVLVGSVYGLGKHLFNQQVGLWAALICILLPRLYIVRVNYLTDYPLTALVAASFWCLTVWRDAKTKWQGWRWALAFGFCFGLAMMVKQTVIFFLFVPLLWLLSTLLRQQAWGRIAQLIGGFLLSAFIFGPWYRPNWIFLFSTAQNAVIDPAMQEGDPPLNTLAAWTYYWNDLPRAVSWPLLVVPLVGLLLYWSRLFPALGNHANGERTSYDATEYRTQESGDSREVNPKSTPPNSSLSRANPKLLDGANSTRVKALAFRWLALFLIASYLICSVNQNKDLRYIMPYLPILSVVLAYGLTVWPRRLRFVRWGAVGLAFLLMCLNFFPIGGKPGAYLAQVLSSKSQNYPYLSQEWPHVQVIDEIIRTQPQLRSTVGVMPRIPEINHNNLNYYGALRKFQVYGREVGVRKKFVAQDARSLSWFITKTGDEATRREAQALLIQTVEQSPDFKLQKNWNLPDRTVLKLYHRAQAPIQVQPLQQPLSQVRLERVSVPEQTPPGVPVPVTYEWSGPWQSLKSGIVLLSWKGVETAESQNSNPQSKIQNLHSNRWLHDHGIAMGELHSGRLSAAQSQSSFRVIEKIAMLPPADMAAGSYTLEATYLNRETGENYPIAVPSVSLNIVPNAPATPAPELDLLTQLRTLAASLPQGRKALDQVFDEIGRINQYDPVQDYTRQTELAMNYRLEQEPQNVNWAYTLAFSNILQKDAEGAIAALKRVVQLDSQNPYAHAYLAFVYLYQWRGRDAQEAIQPAVALNPNIPEIQALSGAAALLQGNVFKAWQTLRGLKL